MKIRGFYSRGVDVLSRVSETKNFSQKHVGIKFFWVAETKQQTNNKRIRQKPQRYHAKDKYNFVY